MSGRIIVVGGVHKGAGKTTLSCFLLKRLPGWGALKVTTTHEGHRMPGGSLLHRLWRACRALHGGSRSRESCSRRAPTPGRRDSPGRHGWRGCARRPRLWQRRWKTRCRRSTTCQGWWWRGPMWRSTWTRCSSWRRGHRCARSNLPRDAGRGTRQEILRRFLPGVKPIPG